MDTIDTTTVSLSATASISEAGGTVTYTATVNHAPASDMTVTLANSQTITILANQTSGSVAVVVAASDDFITDPGSMSSSIASTSGGGLEAVSINATPAVTTIVDTIDTTTVSLSATASISEAGGTVTYTATVNHAPASDMTVTLANSQTITILANQTSGSVAVVVAASDDFITDPGSMSSSIASTSGGGLEAVSINATPAVTTIVDTIDTTTVSLSATASISEAGGTVTYTATVNHAPASDMTVTLANSQTITILANQTSGSVAVVVAASDDFITDPGSMSSSIASTSGGGLEAVSINATPAVTTIVDTIDTTTVSLSATASISEAGGTVTYTATVNHAPASDMTVTLANSQTITILANQTSGSVAVVVAASDDFITDPGSMSSSIASTSGGGLEAVSINATPAVTTIVDTIDTTTVSLSATASISEAGGTVTYTATVNHAPASDMTVTLANSQTITILANQTSGSVAVVVAASDDFITDPGSMSSSIASTSGGGLEAVSINATPAVTTIVDTIDTTTVSLSATASISEAGGTVTYTATVNHAPASDMTVTLANSQTITILANQTSGSVA
ncbi:MAG: hypothetical protein M3A44_04105, partial [Gammaproteobacteria bacterium]